MTRWFCLPKAAEGADPAGSLYRGEAEGRGHGKCIICVQGLHGDNRRDGGGRSRGALF